MKKILASLMGLLVAGLFSACNSGGGGCCGTCTGQEFDEQTEIALGTCDKNHEGNSEEFYRCRMCCSDPTSLYGCYYTWVNSWNEKIKDSDLYCDGLSQEPFRLFINPFPSFSSSVQSSSSSVIVPKTQSSSSSATIEYDLVKGSLKDIRDGQTYMTVTIGTQTWMTENLNYKIMNSYCYDDNTSYCATYGRLYTRWAAKGACPIGWHLPDSAEWNTLINAVGGESMAGKVLKSTSGWTENNGQGGGGTDTYWFSALPAGYRSDIGDCYSVGTETTFWSSTLHDGNSAYIIELTESDDAVHMGCMYSSHYVSVRCLRNEANYCKAFLPLEENSGWTWAVPKECRLNPAVTYGFMIDERDQKVYRTVTIAPAGKNYSEVWMAENLNYYVVGSSWCYNEEDANCEVTGRLYTWAAAMGRAEEECLSRYDCMFSGKVQGICPNGWHLPSGDEWNALLTAVGGPSTAGKVLKSQTGWNESSHEGVSGNGIDTFGFSALPSGYRYHYMERFVYDGKNARFWSSTRDTTLGGAYGLDLASNGDIASLDGYIDMNMFSVRCLKD